MAKTNKKNEDNFLRNVLIVFGSLFIVLMAVMIYYNVTTVDYEYEDFDQVGYYDDIAIQEEDTYAVYYYSPTCGACITIKDAVLEFAKENELGMKVYLLEYESTSERIAGSKQGISGPNNERLTSTPTLMIFQDGEMIEFMVNTNNISEFINDVTSGDYTIE